MVDGYQLDAPLWNLACTAACQQANAAVHPLPCWALSVRFAFQPWFRGTQHLVLALALQTPSIGASCRLTTRRRCARCCCACSRGGAGTTGWRSSRGEARSQRGS